MESLKTSKKLAKKIKKLTLQVRDKYDFLYPILDDPQFNIKLASKKEFYDTRYDGTIKSVENSRDCFRDFQLAPHQLFVKNFMSYYTPYNSLLLYHGLGSGKTCSAIGVCEEMRNYMKMMNITNRIIIIASPNVQNEFRLQLFDERKLTQIGNSWNIEACTGNSFIQEIMPMRIKALTRTQVVSQIKRIINQYYLFMGYTEFSNYVTKKMAVKDTKITSVQKKQLQKKKLQKIFNQRLIVIDEVHNIRISNDNKNKTVALNLSKVVSQCDGIRLLLLSATPMYNSYTEIIWLLNLMNLNDNRSELNIKEVFDNNGNFRIDDEGYEIGKDKLIQKARGYISFVRGENPYLFPYRIYPKLFSTKSIHNIEYPTLSLNGKPIIQPIQYIDIYVDTIETYQEEAYTRLIRNIENIEDMDGFGYTVLAKPIEALNIVFPNKEESFEDITGSNGLRQTMTFVETAESRYNYQYKPNVLDDFGEIFRLENLKQYSHKMWAICNHIELSKGIVLIYSQYLEGGLIPLALALEHLGYSLYDSRYNLLKGNTRSKKQSYIMITGEKYYSKHNIEAIKAATNYENRDGNIIKVILISKAGSEGVDFKFIRQVHILEPWYNMNRIEQIIGRAVRTCSHKDLPFKQRNVQIFMYGTKLTNNMEAADLYVYRKAEEKSLLIGKVSRVLKEVAIDCILNHGQTNFSEKKMNQKVDIELANGKTIHYAVGDKPYSSFCDYMDSCYYTCQTNKKIVSRYDLYNEDFLLQKQGYIIKLIKELYKEFYVLKKDKLLDFFREKYTREEVLSAIHSIIEYDYITDKYNRLGNLVYIGDYYLFQPIELLNKQISLYDKMRPLFYKKSSISVPIKKPKTPKTNIFTKLVEDYTLAIDIQKVTSKDKYYYRFCQLAIRRLANDLHIEKSLLEPFIIAHQIESLLYNDKLNVLNYLYFNQLTPYQVLLKTYFDNYILKTSQSQFIYIIYKTSYKVLILGDSSWEDARETDLIDLNKSIKEKTTVPSFMPTSVYNIIIGFMYPFNHKEIVFKTKNITAKRSKGARCDQASKYSPQGVVNIINTVLENPEHFTTNNSKKVLVQELCIYLEYLLRYYHSIKFKKRAWFFTPELAIMLNIPDYKN